MYEFELMNYVNINYLQLLIILRKCYKSYSAGRFPDFIDLNNLKENRSCVMNWSEQLPCTLVTAFSRTSLFLERFWCKF